MDDRVALFNGHGFIDANGGKQTIDLDLYACGTSLGHIVVNQRTGAWAICGIDSEFAKNEVEWVLHGEIESGNNAYAKGARDAVFNITCPNCRAKFVELMKKGVIVMDWTGKYYFTFGDE